MNKVTEKKTQNKSGNIHTQLYFIIITVIL